MVKLKQNLSDGELDQLLETYEEQLVSGVPIVVGVENLIQWFRMIVDMKESKKAYAIVTNESLTKGQRAYK